MSEDNASIASPSPEAPAVADAVGDSVADEVGKAVAEWKLQDPQMKAAAQVEADLKEAGLDGDDDDGGAPATPKQAQDASFEEEKAAIAKTLRERGRVFKEREAAKAEAEAIKAEAYQLKAQSEQMYRQVQEQAQWLAALKKNPVQALRQAGLDPEDFIMSIAQDGTPEGQWEREKRELREKANAFDQWKQEQEEQRQAWQQQQLQEQQRSHRAQMVGQFIEGSKASTHIKAAMDAGLYSDRTLIAEGDRVAREYFSITGHHAEVKDIVEYLDEQIGKAYSKLKAPAISVPPVSKPPVRARAASLSLDDASERRGLEAGSGKDELAEDRIDKAKQAVKAVMAKRGA